MAEQIDLFPYETPEPKPTKMRDVGEGKPVSGQKKLSGVPELTDKEKAKAAKEAAYKEAADAEKAKDAKRAAAVKQQPSEQTRMNFGNPALEAEMDRRAQEKADRDKEAKDKAMARKAENAEYADKRVKASPLTVSSELAKMKEILAKPKGGGGGGVPSDKMDKMKKMNYKSGGTVKSSASKRADGCAIRGKTRA
jgi:hypothetical protein